MRVIVGKPSARPRPAATGPSGPGKREQESHHRLPPPPDPPDPPPPGSPPRCGPEDEDEDGEEEKEKEDDNDDNDDDLLLTRRAQNRLKHRVQQLVKHLKLLHLPIHTTGSTCRHVTCVYGGAQVTLNTGENR